MFVIIARHALQNHLVWAGVGALAPVIVVIVMCVSPHPNILASRVSHDL